MGPRTMQEIEDAKRPNGMIPASKLREWGVRFPLKKGFMDVLKRKTQIRERQDQLRARGLIK